MNDMPSDLSVSQVQRPRHPYSPPPHSPLYSRTPAETQPTPAPRPRKPSESPPFPDPSPVSLSHAYEYAYTHALICVRVHALSRPSAFARTLTSWPLRASPSREESSGLTRSESRLHNIPSPMQLVPFRCKLSPVPLSRMLPFLVSLSPTYTRVPHPP